MWPGLARRPGWVVWRSRWTSWLAWALDWVSALVNNRTKRLTENENWYPPTEKKSNCEPVSHPLPGVQLTQIPTRPRSDHAENTQGQEHTSRSWNQREPIPHRPTYSHTDWRPCQQDQRSLGQLKLRSRKVKDIQPEIVFFLEKWCIFIYPLCSLPKVPALQSVLYLTENVFSQSPDRIIHILCFLRALDFILRHFHRFCKGMQRRQFC